MSKEVTSAKWEDIRSKVISCHGQTRTDEAERTKIHLRLGGYAQTYSNLASQINLQEEQLQSKQTELNTLVADISDLMRQTSEERGMIEKMNQYLNDFEESHQSMPNIELLGVEANEQLTLHIQSIYNN